MDEDEKNNVVPKQRNLTIRFVVTGFVVIGLLSVVVSATTYFFSRMYALQISAQLTATKIDDFLSPKLNQELFDQSDDALSELAGSFRAVTNAESVAFFDNTEKLIWASDKNKLLNLNERKPSLLSVIPLPLFQAKDAQTIDQNFLDLGTWLNIVSNNYPAFTQHIAVFDKNNKKLGYVRLSVNTSYGLSNVLMLTVAVFFIIFLCSLLVFYSLYKSFKKVILTIEAQEEALNENVRNLSSILSANQKMQSNIRTASARAVELNEQFLRRVGADLHDGPAQMIGYANLRLSSIAKMEVAKQFGHEFHGVKKALEDSLDEIRGISSGLVLPELESMTLEQCMRKVIVVHCVKSNVKIIQDYVDVPEEVPLPIKICAYRFVQEGLNNAEQHGKAEKCRLSVRFNKGVLQVSLKDKGMGFRTSTLESDSVHLGLIGLKDRVESIGGSFHINSELGVGTALRIRMPLGEDIT